MATAVRKTGTVRGLLSIGQVLAKLSPDFPDLTPSKLRFLEEQGLITPERTPSGYRKFSADHVDLLRLILTMQRDHYLPLKVIRQHLDDIAAGKNPALPSVTGLSADSLLSTPTRYTRDEFVKVCGASTNLLQDAVSASLLKPSDSYGDEDVAVLTSLAELQRSGIEPRHLRTMRASAEREYSLIERAIAPVSHRQDPASKARSIERAHEISRHLEVMRVQLLREIITEQTR
jgi:DNA-binding transcriptional MerR regulator